MNESEIVAAVVEALENEKLPYLMAGSLASSVYGIPRSTKDADFVVELEPRAFDAVIKRLEPFLELDPQQHLETLTWTRRYILKARASAFKVELFIKDKDPHHSSQWQRRRRGYSTHAKCEVWLPAAEDVIIQKLRWGRPQDKVDAEQVMAVQAEALDFAYIEQWCDAHGTRSLMEEIRAAIPPI